MYLLPPVAQIILAHRSAAGAGLAQQALPPCWSSPLWYERSPGPGACTRRAGHRQPPL